MEKYKIDIHIDIRTSMYAEYSYNVYPVIFLKEHKNGNVSYRYNKNSVNKCKKEYVFDSKELAIIKAKEMLCKIIKAEISKDVSKLCTKDEEKVGE